MTAKLNVPKKLKVQIVMASGQRRDLVEGETAVWTAQSASVAELVPGEIEILETAAGTDTVSVFALGFSASVQIETADEPAGIEIVEE